MYRFVCINKFACSCEHSRPQKGAWNWWASEPSCLVPPLGPCSRLFDLFIIILAALFFARPKYLLAWCPLTTLITFPGSLELIRAIFPVIFHNNIPYYWVAIMCCISCFFYGKTNSFLFVCSSRTLPTFNVLGEYSRNVCIFSFADSI